MFSRNKQLIVLMLAFIAALSLSANQTVRAQASVKTILIDSMSYSMVLSPDGHTLAVFEAGALYNDEPDPLHMPIRLIDVATGNDTLRLTGASDYVGSVAFTLDGKRLASYHNNGVIYLWDVTTGKSLKQINALMTGARIKFLPDGKTLAVLLSVMPPRILLWDTETSAITSILGPYFSTNKALKDITKDSLGFASMMIEAFDVSPDGKLLATATASDEIDTWDIATNQPTLLRKMSDKKGMFSIRGLSFIQDGKALAYYDNFTKTTHIWNVTTRTETQSLPLGSPAFAISPKGDVLAWAEGKDGGSKIRMVKLAQPDQPIDLTDLDPSMLVILPTSAAFTPDGRQFVAGGFAGREGKNAIYIVTLP